MMRFVGVLLFLLFGTLDSFIIMNLGLLPWKFGLYRRRAAWKKKPIHLGILCRDVCCQAAFGLAVHQVPPSIFCFSLPDLSKGAHRKPFFTPVPILGCCTEHRCCNNSTTRSCRPCEERHHLHWLHCDVF